MTESGTIKVLDFGIAKVLQARSARRSSTKARLDLAAGDAGSEAEPAHLTRNGAIIGTLPYMSPEQWGNGVQVDHRTDIWAVGIMLFRMLAGRHPLEPLRGPQLAVTAFLDEPMPRLREVAPEVPPELAAVVDRCLLKRKDERYEDALSLLRALEPFLPGRYVRELRVDESPYAGLSSFQEADADRFFGRSREIAALVGRLRDRPLVAWWALGRGQVLVRARGPGAGAQALGRGLGGARGAPGPPAAGGAGHTCWRRWSRRRPRWRMT